MASPPPFSLEDQTDEDFFDNLVNDDLVFAGSVSEQATTKMAFSNMSIDDVGLTLEDSRLGVSGLAATDGNRQENGVTQWPGSPKPRSLVVESSAIPISTASFASRVEVETLDSKDEQQEVVASAPLPARDNVVASGGSMETRSEFGYPGSSLGKNTGSKETAVKEVQWSAFRVDPLQFDSDGFGSYTDFLTENVGECGNKLEAEVDQKCSSADSSAANACLYFESIEQLDAQCYSHPNEQTPDVNKAQYWESLYPGWKFDVSTGQWYQINDYDAATTAEPENRNAMNEQQHDQDKVLAAGNGIIMDQRSKVSYYQQSANLVVAETAEASFTGYVSNWNQNSYGTTEYPPNVVLDPQYPGWYYDTNIQQWHTLQSHAPVVQATTGTIHGHYSQVMGIHWDGSRSKSVEENMQQPEPVDEGISDFNENRQKVNLYNTMGHAANCMDVQVGTRDLEPLSNYDYGSSNGATRLRNFLPTKNMDHVNQPKVEQSFQACLSHEHHDNQKATYHSQQSMSYASPPCSSFSYALNEGRSSAGRPPHALVAFGFGGNLILMKDASCSGSSLDYGRKEGSISILGLMDILMKKTDDSTTITTKCGYFHALCQQSFPGPLIGGNASAKDVNKWIDDKIAHSLVDATEGELQRLLLSLLKILCQHYGKLRSPFSSDPSVEDTDGPASAITNLFASVSKNGSSSVQYGSITDCMQYLPTEGDIQGTAITVQNLLVFGRRKEALQCAQAGQLWGLALILAAQLGEKFYVETVKQMANRQFISGSPLRTLYLLIAGQPADVFSFKNSSDSSFPTSDNAPEQSMKVLSNGMLDDWEKHLAIITANRTKDDELVILHLGDCLWREKGKISAAHICYLVAEANFESYSDSARMCLLGADHWKHPRTYASPDAIQRTELYEYSKVLGNSQFILLPFQPYKLVYAYMLAEVGKVSDSLRYCQASLKLLKSSSRTPVIEMWRSLFSSLEDRLRMHLQAGYSTNLDPAKLVGKLFTSIDRSIHRMIGTTPMPQSGTNGKEYNSVAPKVANSQSTMAMSSLIPSGSQENLNDWAINSRTMHSRSASEPDFGKALKQEKSMDSISPDSESKASSRLGRFGSQIFQRTVGWVSRSRSERQAKLGERNKFFYDEKLKRWVEEGVEPQSEEASLPPPPTTVAHQNGISVNDTNSAFKSPTQNANGILETSYPSPLQHASGIPPISPGPNQFSARNKMGVRSRYVDTFNKDGGVFTNSFRSPSTPSVKPAVGATFFAPGMPATCDDAAGESTLGSLLASESSTTVDKEASFSSPSPSSSPPIPLTVQHSPGMDTNTFSKKGAATVLQNNKGSFSNGSPAPSWSGKYNTIFMPTMARVNSSEDGSNVPSSFVHDDCRSNSSLQLNWGKMDDDLHQVEL
ncbi:hypothetical protein MUK42_29709 [Musa troglodytarum]|uniref:Protein transport protein sec16 n=1 Tax=Musa troglodytarum TaxID=320322 RepID=A0A9E7JZJ3_9LILI|nr:hypothetical protein MUK42_29709 [Musa troglodytarum]